MQKLFLHVCEKEIEVFKIKDLDPKSWFPTYFAKHAYLYEVKIWISSGASSLMCQVQLKKVMLYMMHERF